MKRYSHSNNDVIVYVETDVDFTQFEKISEEKVVSDKGFLPTIDEARLKADSLGSSRVGVYDFPDGVDNGLDLTLLRSKAADITEVQAYQKALEKSVDEQKKSALKKIEEEAVKVAEENSKITNENKGDSNSNTSD